MVIALLRVAVVCVAVTLGTARLRAAAAADVPPPIYYVFLTDGSRVAAFGEWARVGDRLVFTVALGETAGEPAMHLASVPVDRVDWPATEQYRDGLRAAHYAATRGDEDFAVLSNDVARLLNDAALATDGAGKLAFAEQARRLLMDWPASHFAYRADEVRQILSLVDEFVSGLRAARGDTAFDLQLVASVTPPPLRALPAPSLRDAVTQALRLADLAESPADRVSLLRAADGVLASAPAHEAWVGPTRATVGRTLAEELDLESRYAALRTRTLASASRAAARADVRGVERAIARFREADTRLGNRRPDTVSAVLAALEERLDAARRLRLARDQWALLSGALQAYRRSVAGPMGQLWKSRADLDDVRSLAGPPAARLERLEKRIGEASRRLSAIVPPADAAAAHALVTSSTQLALQAARLRRSAIASGAMSVARDASAAAAGALMLMERARTDIDRVVRPPEIQ